MSCHYRGPNLGSSSADNTVSSEDYVTRETDGYFRGGGRLRVEGYLPFSSGTGWDRTNSMHLVETLVKWRSSLEMMIGKQGPLKK